MKWLSVWLLCLFVARPQPANAQFFGDLPDFLLPFFPGAPTNPPSDDPPPGPDPLPADPEPLDDPFATTASTARFLTQATFGPTPEQITSLTGTDASQWMLDQFAMAPTYNLPSIDAYIETGLTYDEKGETNFNFLGGISPALTFWKNSITAPDQLRQRMAFALSQIMVVSNENDTLVTVPVSMGYYMDILTDHAFGNYRDLMEAVTYSPAMGIWLTYHANQKGDPETGRVPDENYARELMQLFTIGLVNLNLDGSEVVDENGNAVETYDNDDITGLAKVFTGLAVTCFNFARGQGCQGEDNDIPDDLTELFRQPMSVYPQFHSELEKTFLGTTIPANTGPVESIDQALDTIFNHPNVAPFVGRQLIQRFVTSDPVPAYIERVATAFETGSFTLPNGTVVGDGNRGDLEATIAAVLFDVEARSEAAMADPTFGKVREPVIRFTNWARAFDADVSNPEYAIIMWDTSGPDGLAQRPYGSPSVFNFYRPGFVAPGTLSGAEGLTAPELQLVNAASVPGYANFMTYFGFGGIAEVDEDRLNDVFEGLDVPVTVEDADGIFMPNYDDEMAVAGDTEALIDRIDSILTYGSMSQETKAQIAEVLDTLYPSPDGMDDEAAFNRTAFVVVMTMMSPDYLVQR